MAQKLFRRGLRVTRPTAPACFLSWASSRGLVSMSTPNEKAIELRCMTLRAVNGYGELRAHTRSFVRSSDKLVGLRFGAGCCAVAVLWLKLTATETTLLGSRRKAANLG